MNIENIRCFISLAECLNFTRAASKMHITQTSMSRKISALENELDLVLLYRDTHQVQLTSAGREFLNRARDLIDLYDAAVVHAKHAQNEFQNELKLGVGVYDHVLLNRFLESYVSSLSQKLCVSCQQASYPVLAKDFSDKLLDVMISTNQYEKSLLTQFPGEIGFFDVYIKPWYLLLHKNNPLANEDPVHLEHLSDQTLITLEQDTTEQVRKMFSPYFPIKEAMCVNSFDAKLVLTNANLGVAFAPPFVFPVADRYQNIVLRKTDPPYNLRVSRAYYWKSSQNPAALDFIQKYSKFCDQDRYR